MELWTQSLTRQSVFQGLLVGRGHKQKKKKKKKSRGHKQKKKVQNVPTCNILLLKHFSHGFQKKNFFFNFQWNADLKVIRGAWGNIWRTVVLEAAVYRCSIEYFKYFEKISHKHLWSSCYEMFSWEKFAQKSYFSQYLFMHSSNFFSFHRLLFVFFLVLDSCKFLFPPNLLDLMA